MDPSKQCGWIPHGKCFILQKGQICEISSLEADVANLLESKHDLESREVIPGRVHNLVKNNSGAMKKFMSSTTYSSLLPSIEPIFRDYFACGDDSDCYHISTLQIVDAKKSSRGDETHSQCQYFHADNSLRGLTLIIPLVDMSAENGGTEFITKKYPYIFQPNLEAGQTLIFDSRILHRGTVNNSDRDRPLLVIRYDKNGQSPAPNMSYVGASARAVFGSFIHFIMSRTH